jgi:hypothetical protein
MPTTPNLGITELEVAQSAKEVAINEALNIIDTRAVDVNTIDAKGDLLVGTADNALARLAVGADGKVLVADSTEATGLKWIDQPGVPSAIVDAKGDLIVASGADTPARLAVGANDQIPKAASGEATGLLWGWVGLSDGTDGSRAGSLDAFTQVVADTGTADTEFTVAHGLGRTPVGFIAIRIDRAGIVYDSGTAWDGTNIKLKCSAANAAVTLIIF